MAVYNNSKLKLYETCPRLFYLGAVLNLRRKSTYANLDRDEGSLMHEMLAAWMDPDDPHCNVKVNGLIDDFYDKRQNAAELDVEADAAVDRNVYMHALWDAYLRRYPNETWVVQAVEQKGVTCLGDRCYKCGFVYPGSAIRGEQLIPSCVSGTCGAAIHYIVGVADALVLENGVFKLVDHKTKGGKSPSISDAFLAGFNEARQLTGYMYIFSRVIGRPVAMGIANCIAKLKTIDKKGNPFKRALEIVRTVTDYEAYVSDTLSLIQTIEGELELLDEDNIPLMETDDKRHQPFRRNTDACRNYGLCEMYSICHPARRDWWTVPFDVADDYEISDTDYVRDYRKLADEERR